MARMTSTDAEQVTVAAPEKLMSRRFVAILIALVAILGGVGAYLGHYTQCDWHSSFCSVSVAGTRSEVVVAWLDKFEVYTQTYSG